MSSTLARIVALEKSSRIVAFARKGMDQHLIQKKVSRDCAQDKVAKSLVCSSTSSTFYLSSVFLRPHHRSLGQFQVELTRVFSIRMLIEGRASKSIHKLFESKMSLDLLCDS